MMALMLGLFNLSFSVIATFFGHLRDSISNGVGHFFSNMRSSITHASSRLFSNITKSTSDMFAHLFNFVGDVGTAVISVVSGVSNRISQGLQVTGTLFYNIWFWTSHLVETITACISATWHFIVAALYYTALGILSTLIFIAVIVALYCMARIGSEVWKRMPSAPKTYSTIHSAINETTRLVREHGPALRYDGNVNR